MSPDRGKWRPVCALFGLLALGLLAAGCIPSTYEYPVDFFNEMHYQQSFRRQEPPVVAVPTDAVPITGGEPLLATDAYASQQNPIARTPASLQTAAALYKRNCLPCHGAQGKGDGIVGATIGGYPGAPKAANYTDPDIVAYTDGQIFGIITNGKRDEQTLQGMPSFRNLLTPDERWTLVNQIRVFQGK